jgi:hypothetical protein
MLMRGPQRFAGGQASGFRAYRTGSGTVLSDAITQRSSYSFYHVDTNAAASLANG